MLFMPSVQENAAGMADTYYDYTVGSLLHDARRHLRSDHCGANVLCGPNLENVDVKTTT